jgi:hypothetical protein
MRSLSEDAPIKQTCVGTGNVLRELTVSSAHVCVQSVRKNIGEDMEDRWVTNFMSEDRKRFYLVSSLLDPRTKILSFCGNKYFPSSWKDDTLGYLSNELLGMSTVSMDIDVTSVEGETQLLNRGYGEGNYTWKKRNLNRRLICECRCDERLKAKAEGSTLLVYTG